jgi:hypothetical protein
VNAEQLKINDPVEVVVDTGSSTTPLTVILRTEKDVEEMLAKSRALFQQLHVSSIRIDIQGLPADACNLVETRMNADLQECGCPAGNFAAAASLLVYIFLLFVLVGTPIHWTWSHLLWGIPICLSLAVIGKLSSQLRARLNFIYGLETILRLAQVSDLE